MSARVPLPVAYLGDGVYTALDEEERSVATGWADGGGWWVVSYRGRQHRLWVPPATDMPWRAAFQRVIRS